MKNLTNLSIASNRLTSLPDTIGFLTKLVELKASDNLLDTIPASISKLQKLTTLYLDSNRITYLPSEIGQVKLLATLDLSKNPLQVVPAELNRLKFLRTLTLKRCPLKRDFAVDPTRSPPTLKELAARVIVRQQLPILEITQDEVKSYLASAHTCTFCGGPYFEEVTIRGRIVERGDHRVPLEYRLCAPHWSTDNERLALLFCPLPNSAPSPIPSQLSSRTVSPSLAPKRFSVSTSQSQKSAAGSADRPALVSSNSSPALNLLSDSGRDSTRAGSNSSSSSNSPFSTLRRRRPSVTRSTSFTLPLSSLTKNPSLPTLPTAVGSRGFKATLLKKTGLRTSRSMSFLG
ncbi:hypothetical protein DFS34DRAFT_627120 [Phlyctochytrium arcticum]|nr:hypothetical protein DFS34DRAFT_627120 [Phlyctochytrium arcticum]